MRDETDTSGSVGTGERDASTPLPSVPSPSVTAENIPRPAIVTAAEWNSAQATMASKEEALTEARAALAAERRRMPMARVEKDYRFVGADGEVGLSELFAGRQQLILYKFFYAPDVENWPDGACSGCSMFADSVTHPAHLAARDVTLAFVSDAPQERIAAYKARMGWNVSCYTLVGADFSRDFGVDEWFGINVFLRDGDHVYRTYFLNGPAVEAIGPVWSLLELTPYGRQETSEDSPAGWPQDEPYAWYCLHDAYGSTAEAGS